MSHINTNVNNLNYLNTQDPSSTDSAEGAESASAPQVVGGLQRSADVDAVTSAAPSLGGASNVLSTRPPSLASAIGVNQADLASGTSRMNGLTQGFTHPMTGAMILAMEEGTHNLGSNATTMIEPQAKRLQKKLADNPSSHNMVRATAGAAAGAGAGAAGAAGNDDTSASGSSSGSSASSDSSSDSSGDATQYAASAASSSSDQSQTTSASSSSSGLQVDENGNVGMNAVVNVQTATLDKNNPNSQAAQSLLDSASEAPAHGAGSKCKNDHTEKDKANHIAAATGLPQHQAMTLLRAMDSNPLGGRNDNQQIAPGEDTTIALSLATLTQLKASGGNPDAQNKLRDELTNAANNIAASATSGGKGMTFDQGQSYGKSITNLTSYCQQLAIDSGAQALTDAASVKPHLTATKLV